MSKKSSPGKLSVPSRRQAVAYADQVAQDLLQEKYKIEKSNVELETTKKNLEKNIIELEDTKKTMLNVLEDLNIEKKNLQEANIKPKKLDTFDDAKLPNLVRSKKRRSVSTLRASTELSRMSILRPSSRRVERVDSVKDDFLSIASHELRTPLTVIKGNASLLIKGVGGILPKKTKAMVADIYFETERLINLVNNLLDVSKLDLDKFIFYPKPVDIKAVCKKIVASLSDQAREKKISLKVNADSNLPLVVADEERLGQVLLNLLGNAIKYTQKGTVSVSFSQQKGFVEGIITDTGIGIKEADQAFLFSKFHTAESAILTRQSGSTGLGLYISKLLIEKMGGKLYLVQSKPGKGSTFGFILPKTLTN